MSWPSSTARTYAASARAACSAAFARRAPAPNAARSSGSSWTDMRPAWEKLRRACGGGAIAVAPFSANTRSGTGATAGRWVGCVVITRPPARSSWRCRGGAGRPGASPARRLPRRRTRRGGRGSGAAARDGRGPPRPARARSASRLARSPRGGAGRTWRRPSGDRQLGRVPRVEVDVVLGQVDHTGAVVVRQARAAGRARRHGRDGDAAPAVRGVLHGTLLLFM